MCLERVVLAVGICMEACIETHTWAYTPGIFENHVCVFGRGVLAVGICTEACVETLELAYTEGHF